MIKKTKYITSVFWLFIFINIFTINNMQEIIIDSCNIWLKNLVPSIFPFYIITDLLINYGFIDILKFKFLNKFNIISESAIFIIVFSMLTGFPSSAKYIKSLIKEDLISLEEANKIISFCHFSNPLFIINVIGINVLNNKNLGYLILISHFLANLIIAFIIKFKTYPSKTINQNQEKLGIILTKSINNTFNSLLIILGNLIMFQLIREITFKYFNSNQLLKTIITLILEITSGIFSLKSLNINIYVKAILITSAISFGGICVHSQVYGILSETKVNYKNYFIGRILQALIAPLILSLLLFCYSI